MLDKFERAYAGDRSDKIWLPEHVERFMSIASEEMRLALLLALHTGQRQGDILRMAWSNYTGAHIGVRQSKGGRRGKVKCTKALRDTLDRIERRATVILTTKTGRAFKKRHFAAQWGPRASPPTSVG